jgi:HK97 gp10 family phage protein
MEVRINTQNLDKAFANLPRTTQNKALRPALREGAKVVQQAAIANVQAITGEDSTGTLARNIVVRTYKKFRGMMRAGVQIRKGAVYAGKRDKSGPVRVALVGAVLEYGKKGQPPRSWIRKAAREKTSEAVAAVTRRVNQRMVEAVRDAKS